VGVILTPSSLKGFLLKTFPEFLFLSESGKVFLPGKFMTSVASLKLMSTPEKALVHIGYCSQHSPQ
jgi:hypothetical protein